jgi:phosphate acetyltransferase
MKVIEPQVVIENRTFDEIAIGESATLVRSLSREDIELFAVMSGDVNPAHVDEEYAHSDMFHKIIAHGMWGASLISTLLGTRLPGPGTIYLEQTLRFRHPVTIGDQVTVTVTATSKDLERKRISFACRCANQRDETVIDGTANVIAPTEKVRRRRVTLPDVALHEHGVLFRELITRAGPFEPIRMAVVHPVDRDALLSALQAAQEGLIIPVLVGPENRIRALAATNELDLDGLTVITAEHSHEAADTAVQLARSGQVDALMKGSLDTDELMAAAAAPRTGLGTDRRMSHVFVIDVPTYPRPLLITDAALNVEPDLQAKRDIVQNAIDLALAIGIQTPKVAILSAVETVNPKLRSSLDAAALAKMADRGQIRGGLVDGPLAFDNAVSPAAARLKGISSNVAGQADIVVVPDLESGNMLAKQLDYLADSQAAGIVLGGRVPIALSSRADGVLERVASCALAVLVSRGSKA